MVNGPNSSRAGKIMQQLEVYLWHSNNIICQNFQKFMVSSKENISTRIWHWANGPELLELIALSLLMTLCLAVKDLGKNIVWEEFFTEETMTPQEPLEVPGSVPCMVLIVSLKITTVKFKTTRSYDISPKNCIIYRTDICQLKPWNHIFLLEAPLYPAVLFFQ